MTNRWTVRCGSEEAGPYEEAEVEALVRKGLRDALVRPDGGSWVHLSASPFARFIAKAPDNAHTGWRLAVLAISLFFLYALVKLYGFPVLFFVR